MRTPDQLRELVEAYLGGIELVPELGDLAEAVRYGFEAGGKRVRPVICLATGEAAGAEVGHVLPAAAALELVHSFSLVHDDLPALDNDDVRRGRPSMWARFGEADAILTGDALLGEAFRQAAAYPTAEVARELAEATLGMIGGQHLDIHGEVHDLEVLHRLKTGRLFAASVGCALWAAEIPVSDQLPWREFGEELGLLFQIVDDVIDEDGYFAIHGAEGARASRWTQRHVRTSGWRRSTPTRRCSARSSPTSPYAPTRPRLGLPRIARSGEERIRHCPVPGVIRMRIAHRADVRECADPTDVPGRSEDRVHLCDPHSRSCRGSGDGGVERAVERLGLLGLIGLQVPGSGHDDLSSRCG